jgi:hypothetical protein
MAPCDIVLTRSLEVRSVAACEAVRVRALDGRDSTPGTDGALVVLAHTVSAMPDDRRRSDVCSE